MKNEINVKAPKRHVLDEIKQLFRSFDDDLDKMHGDLGKMRSELAYIKGKLDETTRHNGKLVKTYKEQVEHQQKIIKWFMGIVIVLLLIIAALLGLKVPVPW